MKAIKLLTIGGVSALVAGSAYFWYYTTTPDYAFAQAKSDCRQSDAASFMKKGVVHFNGETRELTDEEVKQFSQSAGGSKEKCPYDELFGKKATKKKLSADELKRLKVDEGYRFSFDGEPEEKALKIIRYNGKWRVLAADVSFNTTPPTTPEGPAPPGNSNLPSSPGGQYQIQYDAGP